MLKYLVGVGKTVVLFLIITVLWGIEIRPVYDSIWMTVIVSGVTYSLVVSLLGLITLFVLVPLFSTIFGFILGMIRRDSLEAGAYFGMALVIPVAFILNMYILHTLGSMLEFFPLLPWGAISVLVLVDTIFDLMFNLMGGE